MQKPVPVDAQRSLMELQAYQPEYDAGLYMEQAPGIQATQWPPHSVSAPHGKGEGSQSRTMAIALMALVVLIAAIPGALYVLPKKQTKDVGLLDALPPDSLMDPSSLSSPVSQLRIRSDGTVPVVSDLKERFQQLKYISGFGLIYPTEDESWNDSVHHFQKALQKSKNFVPPENIKNPEERQEAYRQAMAMDLACLESAALQLEARIVEGTEAKVGRYVEEAIQRHELKMQVRRQQAKAAELWEKKVKEGALGVDRELQAGLLRLLGAVRSRAAASEYLSQVRKDTLQEIGEPVDDHEEDHAYQGVGKLVEAGQHVANLPEIQEQVGYWLDMLFVSI
ncbi:hypothetical protein cyc_06096 [Cyclospora cayetanensis]|uniref:Transmembrane protein n=1 Tax=Cyclospora cayetanensis TaxID=88456 RepID=A0A1D3D6I3_9EIME|nr:hypothetical protein cyc_06096 [Cyclospora cayetanensis]